MSTKEKIYIPSRFNQGFKKFRPLSDFRGDKSRQRWACLVESFRASLGEEIAQFAKRFQVSYQAVQNWEKQGSLPESKRWLTMASLLDLTREQLEAYVHKGDPEVTAAIEKFLKTGKHDLTPTPLFEKNGELNFSEFVKILKNQPSPILFRLMTVTTSILSGKSASGDDKDAIA